MDFFQGGCVFANRDGEGGESDRAACEFIDHRFQDSLVHFVEAILVDLDHFERFLSYLGRDFAIGFDLGIVSSPAEEVIRDSRCSS